MEVQCAGCGRCCISPLVPAAVPLVTDARTRERLHGILRSLLRLRILRPDKPTRSGMLFRSEVAALAAAGYHAALAPSTLLHHPLFDSYALSLRLRHHVVWLRTPDGVEPGVHVPVFACVFLNTEIRRCTIHGEAFYPLRCRAFPYDELSRRGQNAIAGGETDNAPTLLPICGVDRLAGTLTAQQRALADEVRRRARPPSPARNVTSKMEWRDALYSTEVPFFLVTDDERAALDLSPDGSIPVLDLEPDLSARIHGILERECGADTASRKLDARGDADLAREVERARKRWRRFTIDDDEEAKTLESLMVELFVYRSLVVN